MNSLMTDRYEFSMLQTFIAEGIENKRATFEVFSRKLQPGFRFGVFAGLGRLLPMIENFKFNMTEVGWLLDNGVVNTETAVYLKDFRFKGKITAYREGELFFPNSPVMTIEGTLGECILMETLVLSVLNFDSAIAGKAARIRLAAGPDATLIEMGSRRTNEDSAVAAARAAYIAGFNTTSNVLAGMKFGVPTSGTAAHAFTLAHEDEGTAFYEQMKSHGPGTTLLIDTYDIKQGVENAIEAWRHLECSGEVETEEGIGAVRIDSGDLGREAERVRKILDENAFSETKIAVTSDLDEYVIKDLAGAPIDVFGVGTKLVSTPPSGFVYKLVEIETERKFYNTAPGTVAGSYTVDTYMRPVAKKAKDKVSVGGKKFAYRIHDHNGHITEEVYFTHAPADHVADDTKAAQTVVMENGHTTITVAANDPHGIEQARMVHAAAVKTLPKSERAVWYGEHGPFLTAEEAT